MFLHYAHNVIVWYRKEGDRRIARKKGTFDQSQYIQQFMREKYYRLQVLLNKETDADIIERLEEQENKSHYIKALIRQDSHKK